MTVLRWLVVGLFFTFPSIGQADYLRHLPGGTVPAPAATIECRTGLNLSSLLTVTRASVELEDDLSGVWHSFANNVLAQTNKGCQNWESRINPVLHNRDFTNASWTKTNMTAALNATGIDNTANSASTLTATAANATVLQSITLVSNPRKASGFIKRVSGTGEIDITQDGGTTWTPITPCSSGTFIGVWSTVPGAPNCRLSSTLQTITNPNVGIRIVTNGDSIIVDGLQDEIVASATAVDISPPIFTTTVSVTRATDQITLTTIPTFSTNFAWAYTAMRGITNGQAFSSVFSASFGGTNNNRASVSNGSNASFGAFHESFAEVSNGVSIPGPGASSMPTPFNTNFTTAAMATPGQLSYLYSDGSYGTRSGYPTMNGNASTIFIGSLNTGNNCDCYIQKINLWANPGPLWSQIQLRQARDLTR